MDQPKTVAYITLSPAKRYELLTEEARRWVGIQELGGNNRGQLVEIFQRACNIPPGSPWCAAFAQFCLSQVDRVARILDPAVSTSRMPQGAHCMTLWRDTALELRGETPHPGAVVIWQHIKTANGHTGIVTGVNSQTQEFMTIEGNTSPSAGVQRDGDGVFSKTHKLAGIPSSPMQLIGFISPWGKL